MEQLWIQHIENIRSEFEPLASDGSKFDDEDFPEGRKLYRLHRTYERNSDLIAKVKAKALQENGCLACIVCQFDFSTAYGSVGEGYIECHHTVPVSELGDGASTRLSDVVLVCSNCHRMLHRKRPWLTIDKLQTLLIGNQ